MKAFTTIHGNLLLHSIYKILGICLLFFGLSIKSFAGSGLYDAYAILSIKGAVNSYKQYSAFDLWSIGSFNNTETLVLNGAQNKTFKNGTSNVTGGQLAYRVYRTGNAAPSFSFINLPYRSDDGGGNQTWEAASANINLLSGLESGVYTLEVYWQAYTNDGDSYYNNSGNNYKATFTYGYVTNADGAWNTTGTWIGNAVPPAGADVIINHFVNVSDTRNVRSVFINSAKSLVVDASQILIIAGGIRGTGAFTVNGTLQLNAGYSINLTPVYGSSSKLIYNSGGTPAIGSEWTVGSGAIGTTPGYPQDIDIQNSTTLTLNAITTNRGLAGILALGTGTTSNGSLTMGGTANKLTVNGNLVIGGNTISGSSSLTLSSNAASASIEVGGNWTRSSTGIFNPTSRGVIFIGSSNSTISTNTSDDFPYLIANKTAGSVLLNNSITVTNTLTVNGSSTFSLNGNSLTVPNLAGSSTTATINNGHASTNVTLTVNNSAANTFAGLITNGSTATVALTKSGAGDLTLSGANSYTGTTTLFGGSKLFLTNNMSIGPLNMLGSSSLDLGSGAAGFTINFASSNTPAWTGTLTIFNWTPSAGKTINVAGVGLTNTQLGQINFDNYGLGSKFAVIEVKPLFLYVTLASGAGILSDVNSWLLNDKPTSFNGTESVYIQPGFNLTMDVTPTIFLRVEVAGTLTMTSQTMTVAAGGDFRIAGNVSMTAASVINFSANDSLIAKSATASFSSSGTLNFLGAFSITSNSPNALLLPNVNLSASVNFGDNSTIQNGSSLFMLAGGFVDTKAPSYAIGSNLVYNTDGAYNRGTEWSSNSGNGYPANVRIGTTTTFRLSNGTPTVSRQMSGSLTIDANRIFTLEDGPGMSVALTVLGDVNVNGELRLGNAIGGDIKVGGNYTVAANPASVFNNNRAVFFIGSGDQLVTKTGGGIVYFDFIVVNKPSGNVKMTVNTNAYIISQVNNDLSLKVLQLLKGDIDMNGGLITLQGDNINSLNIFVDGGSTRRIFTSTGSGQFQIIGSNASGVAKLSVTAGSAGSNLLFDNNVLVTTTVGVNFGAAGITTVNSIFQIEPNGYVITNSPNYGTSSTLIYNNGPGGYKRNTEWNTDVAGSFRTGYPQSIIVKGNTPLQLNSTDFPASFALGCSGNFTVETGSSVTTAAMAFPISILGSLNIDGTLTLSTNAAGLLNVGGSWSRTGTFVQNERNVNFNGSNDGTLTATGGQTFSFITLNKTSGGRLTINENVAITDSIGLKSGKLTLNSKGISIISTATKTARVGVSGMTSSDITYTGSTGYFFVQRYMPDRRSWRLVSAPFETAGSRTINEAWQELQARDFSTFAAANASSSLDSSNTFGTQITGGSIANGFDQGAFNNASLRFFSAAIWSGVANTNATTVNSREGWMLFVRGDRKNYGQITTQFKLPLVTTLRPRGQIFLGDKRIPASGNLTGFQVVGNPYASAVDFNTADKTGFVPNTYTVWDPYLNGTYGAGAFVTMTRSGGTYLRSVPLTGTGTSTYDNLYIPSGAAVMVDFGGGGSLTFKESDKNALSTTTAFRPVRTRKLQTVLYTVENDTTAYITDGNLILFNRDFSNAVDMDDAGKVSNFSENFSMRRDGKLLSIERKNLLYHNDTIFYDLAKMRLKNYRLEFIMENIETCQGTAAFFEDLYLNTMVPVTLNAPYQYNFSVTIDTGSYAANRFRLVFKKSIDYTSLKAIPVGNNVSVEWKVANEFYINSYVVERSTKGDDFSKLGNVNSAGNSITPVGYNWIDPSLTPGVYYYRIKCISKNNVVAYSNVEKIILMKPNPTIYIAPNPITDNIIHLQMNTVKAGKYMVRLLNNAGQVMQTSTINHTGANTLYTITLNQNMAKGTYRVELSAKGKKTMALPILVQ